MSWSGPESGGLVLGVDQKKWPGLKTDKKKKIKKLNDNRKNVI
jgi:hypothetical protein